MKVLIIPDVHGRKFWLDAKNEVNNFDKIIFLGDYVDPYPDEKLNTLYENPFICFKEIIEFKKNNLEKVVLLFGNHVLHYLWSNFPESTRYNRYNARDYYGLIIDNSTLFNLGWIEDDVIFTHAGITEFWKNVLADALGREECSYLEVGEFLMNADIFTFDYKLKDILGMISSYRGGFWKSGSCEWADVREHVSDFVDNEIVPFNYEGCYQVFGHSQLRDKPLIYDTWACLDCRKMFIMDTITHKITQYESNNSLQ